MGSGNLLERQPFEFRHISGKHQLMALADCVWKAGKGFNETSQVFAGVAPAGVEDEGFGDTEFAS